MNRVEKFRQANRLRKKYIFSILFFIFLVAAGISCADYAVNNLLEDKKSLEIVAFHKLNNSIIEVSFFNDKFYLNPVYIYRDYQRLKKSIQSKIRGD